MLNSRDLPTVGMPFQIDYQGPNGTTPVSDDHPYLLIGYPRIALPFPQISSLQPTNCTVYVDPQVTIAMPPSGTSYATQITLPIPMDPALIGAAFYVQFATLYQRFGQPSLVMVRFTNGGECLVGM